MDSGLLVRFIVAQLHVATVLQSGGADRACFDHLMLTLSPRINDECICHEICGV